MSMIKPFFAAALLLATAAGTAPAAANVPTAFQPIVITVTGQGSASQAPDMATLSANVVTNDDAAARATSENNSVYQRLVSALAGLGLTESAITTTYYNMNFVPRPVQEQSAAGAQRASYPIYNRERYGYVVTRSLSIKIAGTSRVGKVIDAAVAAGATDVNGVNFGVENSRAGYVRALRAAVEDAQSQANAMASAAHLRIVRIKSMSQGYPQVFPSPMRMGVTADVYSTNVPTNIPASDVHVSATVTITYEAH